MERFEHVGWVVGVDDRDAARVVRCGADPDERRHLFLVVFAHVLLVLLQHRKFGFRERRRYDSIQ